jgi:hypothetical protein
MWVRRNDDEIAAIKRRKRARRLSPVGAFVMAALLTIFVVLVPHSPRPTFSLLPALVTFLLAFTLLYMSHALLGRYQLFGITRLTPPSAIQHRMICPACRTAQFDTPSQLCACGGRLEPLEYWRWTDEENLPPALT